VLVAVVTACNANGEPIPSGGSSSTRPPVAALQGTILFTRAGGPFGESTVFTAHADGTSEQQINQLPDGCCPRFSPDGTRILASATAGPLMTVHPDGTDLRPLFTPPKGRTAITPTWSPDGSLLLFGLATITGTPHPADELAVVHANGTGLTPIVTTPDFKAQPEWIKAN